MRRRWRWQWDREKTEDRACAIAFAWSVVGAVAVPVIMATIGDKHGRVTAAGWLAVAIYLAPMAIAALVVLVRAFVVYVCRDPPLRRVTEPVRTDLREEQLRRDADA